MPPPPDWEPTHEHPVVAALDDESSDDLKQSTADLAAWVDYLLKPEYHEGPAYVDYSESENERGAEDGEVNYRGFTGHLESSWLTVSSVLRDFDNVDKIFEAARLLNECKTAAIEPAYQKYLTGYLCVSGDAGGAPDGGDLDAGGSDAKYPMEIAFKTNLTEMRKSWEEPASYQANDWENEWIRFAVGNENCFFVIAEALVRYRALYTRARQELDEATKGLTRRFLEKLNTPDVSPGDGPNWPSALAAGAGVMTVTVITGGTAAMAFGSLVLGAATALAQEHVSEHSVPDPGHWSDLVEGFHVEVTTKMRNLAGAIDDVHKTMVADFNAIREGHGLVPPEPDKTIREPPEDGRDINPEYLIEGVERYIDQPVRDHLQPNSGKYSDARSLTGADPGWYPHSSSIHPDVVTASEAFLNRVTELATDALDGHGDMIRYFYEYGEDLKYVAETARASDNRVAGIMNQILAELESF